MAIKLTLENCVLPNSKLECAPSSLDGLDPESEFELRILGTELIQTSGILLKLPQVAMATGQVLFQRFYYTKSFVRYPMETTAMACILLASKIEEDPRRIRDVANVFHHMKQIRAGLEPKPFLLDQDYINRKSEIVRAERRLLKELGFCVHVKHPHKFIVTLLQVLENEKNQVLMQTSWNYMNDSLRTDIFLRYPPETIACACVQLSANLLQIPLPTDPAWYEVFGVSQEEIKNICLAILRLYSRKKPDQGKLEAIIDDLRKEYQNSKRLKTFDNGESELNNGINQEEKIVVEKTFKEDFGEKTKEKILGKSSIEPKSPKIIEEESDRLKRRSSPQDLQTKKLKSSTKSEIRSTVKTASSSRNNVESPYYEDSSKRRSSYRHIRTRSRSRERRDDKERDRRSGGHHVHHNYHHRKHHKSSKSRNKC